MKILYLHNFGDAENDIHYEVLHQLFPNAEITTVSNNYTEIPIIDLIFDLECSARDADYIVGIGYGGFLAYLVGISDNTNTVLVNPYIPMADYLSDIPYMEENRDTMNSLWLNNQGDNRKCHILLDAKIKLPDTDKVFTALKDTAEVSIYCDPESLVYSQKYKDWLTSHII